MPRKKNTKAISAPQFRAECFLLCDHARVENTKLYVLGGGWDLISPNQFPERIRFYIAARLIVTADPVPELDFRFQIVDENGQEAGNEPLDLHFDTTPDDVPSEFFEISFMVALGTNVTITEAGHYTVLLLHAKQEVARASFRVMPPPAPDESDNNEKLKPSTDD